MAVLTWSMFWIWSALDGTAGGGGTARPWALCALADPETVRARTASVAASAEPPIGRPRRGGGGPGRPRGPGGPDPPIGRPRRRKGRKRVIRDAPFEMLRRISTPFL